MSRVSRAEMELGLLAKLPAGDVLAAKAVEKLAIDLTELRCPRCARWRWVVPEPGWPVCCGGEMEEIG